MPDGLPPTLFSATSTARSWAGMTTPISPAFSMMLRNSVRQKA